MNTNTLLADPAAIEIVKFVSEENIIKIVVRSIQQAAHCPQCGTASSSLKTHYIRCPADLPWHGVAVRLELHTRKLRCRNELCPQKVFCERLPKVAAAYARRTVRLVEMLTLLAFTLGGRGGSRVAAKLNFPAGKDTLLGVVRRRQVNQTVEDEQPVKVLGVDDFAFRRGCNYGTILVDLERRRPIDLLPDRSAETLTKWLRQHPAVEIISRDRSSSYADAAHTGAPQAEQVADRWHLLKNLGDLVERFFVNNHRLLIETAARIRAEHRAGQPKTVLPIGMVQKLKPPPARRQRLFDAIKKLQADGKTLRGITRELQISRNTVRRYSRCAIVPQLLSQAGRRSRVLPFAGYLKRRWLEAEHNAFRLWQEIKARGFSGEVDSVQRFVREWRSTPVGKLNCSIPLLGISSRQAAKLLLNPALAKDDEERNYLSKLCEINPAARTFQKLGNRFQQIVKEKRADLFDDWLADVRSSEIPELKNWANGLLADEAAVRNALSSEWSNGQTEGQVNRLKTIKRQMYGRANFDLLRARVLHRV